MEPVESVETPDPVVEVFKRDVDRTLFERNLRLTPSERIEQLQRFVAFIAEAQAGVRRKDLPGGGHAD